MLVAAGTAAAHVEITPSSLPKGGDAMFSFSVPNEEQGANTIGFEVTFPTKTPIASVQRETHDRLDDHDRDDEARQADAPPTTVRSPRRCRRSRGPRPPAASHRGSSTSSRCRPARSPRRPSKLEFKALQTYNDGTIVRWIDPVVKGTPEPEHPAPTVTLTKAH